MRRQGRGAAPLAEALALLALEPRLGGLLLLGPEAEAAARLEQAAALWQGWGRPCLRLPAAARPVDLQPGWDLGDALARGRLRTRPGLLQRARGGALVLHRAQTLDRATAAVLAAALEEGHPFVLLAAADPREGEVPAALREVAGLHLPAGDRPGWGAAPPAPPPAPAGGAGRPFPTPGQLARLCRWAGRYGVCGQRGELAAAWAAGARALLYGRARPSSTDLARAARWVLVPRASPPGARPAGGAPPPPPVAAAGGAGPENGTTASPGAETVHGRAPGGLQTPPPAGGDRVPAPAQAAPLPEALARALEAAAGLPAGRPGPGRRGPRARDRLETAPHGRPEAPRRAWGNRLALWETLRAAAPFQRLRGRDPLGPPVFHPEDLRWHRSRPPRPMLYVFVVDASASMAPGRLSQVKGIALALLEQAYGLRARVALVGCQGPRARLLLPPARSREAVRQALAGLPAGGGTPLAEALRLAAGLLGRERDRGGSGALVVCTDGRANVPLPGSPPGAAALGQALQAAGELARLGLPAAVIDGRPPFAAGSDRARSLAVALRAAYVTPAAAPARARIPSRVAGTSRRSKTSPKW